MRVRGPFPFRVTVLVASSVLAAACSSHSPTQVPAPVEAIIASGDGQFGVVGEELSDPLRVSVRSVATGAPKEELSILWDVTQGDASIVGVSTTLTDSTGSSEVRLRLGASPGEVHVRATVQAQADASVTFTVFAVNTPTLTEATPSSAAAGDTITLTGTNFSPVAEQNTVLFSGVRGRVTSASSTELRVVVPPCLPARDVDVTEMLGVVASASVPLTVTGGVQLTTLQVGEVLDVADDGGFPCYALPGGTGAGYLTIVYSGSSVGAASYAFELTALSSSGPAAAPTGEEGAGPAETSAESASDAQLRWDEHLRGLEHELVRQRSPEGGGATGPAKASSEVPSVGDTRTFSVLNDSGGFDQVTAIAQYVGDQAAIFVDQDAPSGGFTASDLEAFAQRFDDVIYPVDTNTFGAASDLDGNQRIVILFTPSVNKLTPRGSSGVIGGFFYGNDLLPDQPGSNRGEIFYALVPDPNGVYSTPHTVSYVLSVVPAILAHEFMHMIHFNQRVLIRKAAGQESLWLAEGLAQMAEEIVARAYDDLGDATSAELFRSGDRVRARRYLQGTDTVSLVVSTGQGSLAERGAGFLFILYLEDQEGIDVLTRLTQTTRTGVTNVEAEVGELWPDLVADWWSANYLDGPNPESGPLAYPSVDLRGYLGGLFPLAPTLTGSGDFAASGALPSSSAAYYGVTPPIAGSTTLRLGGQGGGPSAPQAVLRMRIIRVS